MGIFDRFKKKKGEEFVDFSEDSGFESQIQEPFSQQNFSSTNNQDIHLLLSKLELINVRLESIERRLTEIEKIAKESQEPERRW